MRPLAKTSLPALGLIITLVASSWLAEAQVPRKLEVVLIGDVFSSRTAQQGLLHAVPWGDFAAESFPRDDVPVQVGLDGESARPMVEDARKQRYDRKYANLLLEKSGFYRETRELKIGYASHETRDSARWLSRFFVRFMEENNQRVEVSLQRVDRTDLPEPPRGEGFLWIDFELTWNPTWSPSIPRTWQPYRFPRMPYP